MATMEERISRVETALLDYSATLGELRGLLVGLTQKVDQGFEAVNRRFEGVERRFESMERRFDNQDAKFSKFFLWVIMAQLMTLLAIVAGLFGIVTRLLP